MSIRFIDTNPRDPSQSVEFDTRLLEQSESAATPTEWLRLWECSEPIVVVGRATNAQQEVYVDRCQRQGIPIVQRPSGGAAVVAGPGCLMYSVILSLEHRPQLRMIDQAHEFVLGTVARALRNLDQRVEQSGVSDLTIDNLKFSGNSLRCKRDHLLYHGTILYDFRLEQISELLRMPPRQPDYRQQRDHESFVMNFPATANQIQVALKNEWLGSAT